MTAVGRVCDAIEEEENREGKGKCGGALLFGSARATAACSESWLVDRGEREEREGAAMVGRVRGTATRWWCDSRTRGDGRKLLGGGQEKRNRGEERKKRGRKKKKQRKKEKKEKEKRKRKRKKNFFFFVFFSKFFYFLDFFFYILIFDF